MTCRWSPGVTRSQRPARPRGSGKKRCGLRPVGSRTGRPRPSCGSGPPCASRHGPRGNPALSLTFGSILTSPSPPCRSRFLRRSWGSSRRRTSWSAFIRRGVINNGTSGCCRASQAARCSGIGSPEGRQQNNERCCRGGCENSRKRSYTTPGCHPPHPLKTIAMERFSGEPHPRRYLVRGKPIFTETPHAYLEVRRRFFLV
jgi:hypothetical protein